MHLSTDFRWKFLSFCSLGLCLVGLSTFKTELAIANPHASAQPLLTGIYTPGFPGDSSVFRKQVKEVEDFSSRHSLVGMFIDLEASNPGYDIPTALGRMSKNSQASFVNFTTRKTAADIAAGKIDRSITKMAKAYKAWAGQTETGIAFIAPLPEMNSTWEVYGGNPQQFKLAYRRIQDIFEKVGVPADRIRWVFAPNGWSQASNNFELYYPGGRHIDIVTFSAYNWGYCSAAAWKAWQNPDAVFGAYINRLKLMAPTKIIFIAQTASTDMTVGGVNPTAKNQWLEDSYSYLANAGVRGVMYFNIDKECTWAVHSQRRSPVEGYRDALENPALGYQSPEEIQQVF